MDVSRAFFHTLVPHCIHVELCEGAVEFEEDREKSAKLTESLYGAKEAAQHWRRKVGEFRVGFRTGRPSPIVLFGKERARRHGS